MPYFFIKRPFLAENKVIITPTTPITPPLEKAFKNKTYVCIRFY